MVFYDKNAKSIYDKDGICYIVEIGYKQMVFADPIKATEYAKTTVQSSNVDIVINVVRRIDQYTGEIIVDE